MKWHLTPPWLRKYTGVFLMILGIANLRSVIASRMTIIQHSVNERVLGLM